MSKNTLVTTSQTESVRKMANEKKIGRARFQEALDDGRISRFLDNLKVGAVIIASLQDFGLTLSVPAQPECAIVDCFTNREVFVHRDPDFDNLLPATLPASGQISVNGYELTEVTAEAELATVGKPFTNLTQIDDLILRTESGENTGLITNAYANLFFLQVDASVFTVYAYRGSDGWSVYCYRFNPRGGRDAGFRFFSPET